jgi:hypothetical protein
MPREQKINPFEEVVHDHWVLASILSHSLILFPLFYTGVNRPGRDLYSFIAWENCVDKVDDTGPPEGMAENLYPTMWRISIYVEQDH